MVECDLGNMGCQGGYLSVAWSHLEKHGICDDSCYAYHSGDGHVEKCHNECDDGSDMTLYKCASGSVVHPTGVDSIKREIFNNGPAEIAFTVYQDFMSYKEGIYQHTSGSMLGGHAVKVVGWGTEGGVDYWMCANSWGSAWGEEGYFKIKQGDCGINNQIYACAPEL